MERRTTEPRPGWQQTVEEQGLIYPLTRYPDGSLRPYWDESAYYVFSLPEVEALEEVVEELHAMCLAAAAHIVENDRFAALGITDARLTGLIAESWRRRAELPSIYGRFDLRYDGTGPAEDAGVQRRHPHVTGRGRQPPVVLDGGPLPGR